MTPQDTPSRSGKDAAQLLGISPEAVRKRLDRGALQGVKRGRSWVVFLDANIPQDTPQDAATGQAPDALIAQLRDENAYLRQQLDH